MRGISSSLRLPRSLAGPSTPHQPFKPPRLINARRLTSRSPIAPVDPPSPLNSAPASSSSPPSDPQRIPSGAGRYLKSLTALSERTGVPLPSLAVSFVVLHELTAIVPLIILYWIFAALGTGASLVAWVEGLVPPREAGPSTGDLVPGSKAEHDVGGGGGEGAGWKGVVRGWYDEGEKRISRVGRRYGILGYTKDGQTGEAVGAVAAGHPTGGAGGAGEKVANALAAYIVVKALLPLRIGVSLAAAPMFARVFLNPVQRLWRRGR